MIKRPIPPFHCVYLLRSRRLPASFYVGSTPHPRRRLKQHNGMVQGGAKRTANAKRPWEMAAFVSGFPSKIAALQFEWAWQNPHVTRHIPEGEHITLARLKKTRRGRTSVLKGRELIKDNIKNLHLLLRGNSFQRLPLELRFFSLDTFNLWQVSRKTATIDIPDRIPIHLDKIATENGSGATALDDNPVSLAGLADVDITYASLKPQLMKSTSMLSNSKKIHCAVCRESLSHSNDLILVCSGDGCDMTSHLSCLAGQFIKNHDDSDALIPIEGSCSVCSSKLKWSDLMRDLSLRRQDESVVKLILKEPRRKNGKLSEEIPATAGMVAPALSVDSVDQHHGRPIQGFDILNDEDSDLDGLHDDDDEEDEIPQSFVESWDDVGAIADVEFASDLELESEDGKDLPVVSDKQRGGTPDVLAQPSNLSEAIPSSDFHDIDDSSG